MTTAMIDPNPRPTRKPSPTEIAAAKGRTLPDLIGPGLRVLFCGINPSLYSAAVGHHFARPGNRFWPSLAASGFTPRVLDPSEEAEILGLGLGVTNVVARATAAADELDAAEFVEGGRLLEAKIVRYRPRAVAFLGIMAYRAAFAMPKAVAGPQEGTIGGARVWALPSPSGRNGHFSLGPIRDLYRTVEDASTGA